MQKRLKKYYNGGKTMLKKCLFTIVVLAIIVVIGCRKKEEPVAKRVRLIYSTWEHLPAQVKANKSIIDKFNKIHPNIEVKMQQSTIEKILVQMAGGTAPDIFFWQGSRIPELAKKGVILSLDDLIKEDPNFDINDYFAVSLNSVRYKEKLYLFPTHTDFFLLFYNKTLFDKNDVEYPGADLTWESLIPLAQKFVKDTNGDGKIDIFGMNRSEIFIDIMLQQKGLSYFDSTGTKINFNDPIFIDILQYLKDMKDKYNICPLESEVKSIGNLNVMFETGRLAMAILGSWILHYSYI